MLLFLILQLSCDAEIYYHQASFKVFSLTKHYVLKLDISMHDPSLMTVVKGISDVTHNLLRLFLSHPSSLKV
jgi:hypothetical protein